MNLKFTKMQACGNDYVYVDCTNFSLVDASAVAKKLSPRRYSVGSDGLVVIKSSRKTDVCMEIYNADGSRAELCGNALRCVAKYCFERKKFSGNIIGIETDCGEKIVEKIVRDKKTEKTDDVRSSDFFSLKNFRPDLYNTEIFSVTGKNSASARVFERGSGETLSCGSGACAIAAFGVYSGYFSLGEITVKYPGGTLYVNVDKNYLCTLTGEANFVFDGEVRL